MKEYKTDLKDELKKNPILLMMVEAEDFSKKLLKTTIVMSHNFNKICYVTITRPYELLKDILIQKDVDIGKFFFIDLLPGEQKKEGKDVKFITPDNLTDISIAFSEAIQELHIDSSVFDNISPLLVYNTENHVLKLLISIISQARDNKLALVIIMLKTERDVSFVKELFIFVDKVV